jgi:hypothetical protein
MLLWSRKRQPSPWWHFASCRLLGAEQFWTKSAWRFGKREYKQRGAIGDASGLPGRCERYHIYRSCRHAVYHTLQHRQLAWIVCWDCRAGLCFMHQCMRDPDAATLHRRVVSWRHMLLQSTTHKHRQLRWPPIGFPRYSDDGFKRSLVQQHER